MHQITMWKHFDNVNTAACGDKYTGNNHINLQLPFALWRLIVSLFHKLFSSFTNTLLLLYLKQKSLTNRACMKRTRQIQRGAKASKICIGNCQQASSRITAFIVIGFVKSDLSSHDSRWLYMGTDGLWSLSVQRWSLVLHVNISSNLSPVVYWLRWMRLGRWDMNCMLFMFGDVFAKPLSTHSTWVRGIIFMLLQMCNGHVFIEKMHKMFQICVTEQQQNKEAFIRDVKPVSHFPPS